MNESRIITYVVKLTNPYKRISKREVNLSPKTVDAFKPKARVY